MATSLILIQSFLANGIYNFDSFRFRDAPIDTREESWTEAWGYSSDKDTSNPSGAVEIPDDAAVSLLTTVHPQLPITLVQYRPAWFEQAILSMAGIPYVVLNSRWVCSEATGQLPYLRDIRPSEKPIIVGRQDPSSFSNEKSIVSQNCILDHLLKSRNLDLDSHIVNEQEKSMSTLIISMVTTELHTLLMLLRYEDSNAWDSVYRKQCIGATCPNGNSGFAQVGGWFQAWSERRVAQQRLGNKRLMTVEEAVSCVRKCYESLETQLSKHDSQFFLGRPKPSLVDAYLWDHLAQALCDVHLVVVLADFPRLVKYFQTIYTMLFESSTKDPDWKVWNREQNLSNSFQQLPIVPRNKKKFDKFQFKDAIELMLSLSVHQHDLQETLLVTKQKRDEEPQPKGNGNFMGGNLTDPKQTEASENESPHAQKIRRENKRNDQLWISGVVGATVLALVFLQSPKEA